MLHTDIPEIPEVTELFYLEKGANSRAFNDGKPNLLFLTKRIY